MIIIEAAYIQYVKCGESAAYPAGIACIMARSVMNTRGTFRSRPSAIMRSTFLRTIQRREGAENERV